MNFRKSPHRYPIGIQTFSNIREDGYLYVDKTEYVYRVTHDDAKYVFLSRPRRFGKSLLTSTLRSYFEGRKELFDGLAIEKLETEWKQHPVLHFSMAGGKHMDEESLERYLSSCLSEWEKVYGRNAEETDANTRFKSLIRRAYEQTGEKVVVLIDEYDAPLLDVVHEDENLPKLRKIMRNFYSPLKDADPYLRFVFLTGITKFSQVSIFSELNNIKNISMIDAYAGICGITKEELLTQMSIDIDYLADNLKLSREDTVKKLQAKYDGYHFTEASPDIYNPFSLLNCFSDCKLGSYWFGSGTPTYLIEMLRKFGMSPIELGFNMAASAPSFDAPTESLGSAIPLLYQSGYITIKDYIPEADIFELGIPNEEVRTGLMQSLVRNYINIQEADTIIGRMTYSFYKNNIEEALQLMQTFFKTVPYCRDIDHEGSCQREQSQACLSYAECSRGSATPKHWQQMLYVIFSLFGAKGDVEVHTSDGRIDLVMALHGKLYLMEIKLDKSAHEALDQINLKDYDRRFSLYDLPIIKIGINFSTKERTITEWEVGT